jgi:PBP1b-binding outer membrane lipoprotein LpoB
MKKKIILGLIGLVAVIFTACSDTSSGGNDDDNNTTGKITVKSVELK